MPILEPQFQVRQRAGTHLASAHKGGIVSISTVGEVAGHLEVDVGIDLLGLLENALAWVSLRDDIYKAGSISYLGSTVKLNIMALNSALELQLAHGIALNAVRDCSWGGGRENLMVAGINWAANAQFSDGHTKVDRARRAMAFMMVVVNCIMSVYKLIIGCGSDRSCPRGFLILYGK